MSIAPLRGRPAPLLIVRRREDGWPRSSAGEIEAAPLSTRARRLRRRRAWAMSLAMAIAALLVTGAAWTAWNWRG